MGKAQKEPDFFSQAVKSAAKAASSNGDAAAEDGTKYDYDLIVVGAGLSGAVIAERASSQLGLSSLVIDKRDHIGGNCYDYIDKHGIRVSLYGVHIFHTKYPRVEEYVKKFSKWIPYYHRVVGRVKVRSESGLSSERVILSIRM